MRRLRELAPALSVGDESLGPLAAEVGAEVFVRAVELHFDAEPQFWRKYPLKGLRTRCAWAAEKLAEERAHPPRAVPPPKTAPPPQASSPPPKRPAVKRRVLVDPMNGPAAFAALRNWHDGRRDPAVLEQLDDVLVEVVEPQPQAPHESSVRRGRMRDLHETDRAEALAHWPELAARMTGGRPAA